MDEIRSDDAAPGPDPGAAEAIRCADCARSDSLVTDLDPVDVMPISAEAMAGFPDGVPRAKGMDRRAFLRTGALGMASVYAASRIDWTRAFEAAVAEGASPSNQLVMIFLNGGNDGLNTVVPIADYATYAAKRPQLARIQGPSAGGQVGCTIMPGTGGAHAWANPGVSGAGNNGDTRGFDTLWGDGTGGPGSDLAVWPAADYTPANRSHFDSRDYWFAGALQKMTTGWLGRWLDLYGSPDNPLQAVSLDSSISKQIRTASAPVAAVRSLNGAEFRVDGVSTSLVNTTEQIAPIAAVPVGAGNPHLARVRDVYGRTVQVSRSLRTLAGAGVGPGYPALRPVHAPAVGRQPPRGQPRDQDHHHRLGLVRHARQPDPEPGPPAADALEGPRGLQGRSHRPGHRGPRADGGLLGVRATRRVQRERHRPRGGRPDDGHGVVGAGRAARRLPRARIARPGRPAGDHRLPLGLLVRRRGVARRRPRRGHPGRRLLAAGAPDRVTGAGRVAGALFCVSLVAATSALAAPRLHRTRLPPPAPLPSSLAVDEKEWSVTPSRRVVAAGPVALRVYNRGMDDHDLTVVDSTGATQRVYLSPGDTGVVHATFAPGVYKVYCALFAGSASSHEALGMVAYIRARR